MKDVADSQKEKIFCPRGHRDELLDKMDKIVEAYVLETNEFRKGESSLQEEILVLKDKDENQMNELERRKIEEFDLENDINEQKKSFRTY